MYDGRYLNYSRSLPFLLDFAALARAHASPLLAIDPEILGSTMTLPAAAPPDSQAAAGSSIAVVSIMGPLAQRADASLCGYLDGYDAISARFCAACESNPSAIVLRLDGPGGDVVGGEDAIAAMCAARDACGAPVYASIDGKAHSMTYWLAACVANAGVYLGKAASAGSVGVLAVLGSNARKNAAEGIDLEVVRDPPGKAAGISIEPISDEARARATEGVGDAAGRFYAAIGAVRGMKPEDVRALNGNTFTGEKAVAAGLADGVLNFSEVCQLAAIQTEKDTMIPKSLAALLGVSENANALEIETATKALEAKAAQARISGAFAATVLALAGAASTDEALGSLAAWKETHATTASSAAKREHDERDSLCAELVTLGGATPGEVWADPALAGDGAKRAPSAMFASQPIGVLRGYVAKKRELKALAPAMVATVESKETLKAGDASAADLESARRAGVTLKSWLEAKAEQAPKGAEVSR